MASYATRTKLTEADLWQQGPLVRVSDLMAITGWSRDTIIRAAESGDLPSVRLAHLHKAPYYFARHEVCAWLTRCGWTRRGAA